MNETLAWQTHLITVNNCEVIINDGCICCYDGCLCGPHIGCAEKNTILCILAWGSGGGGGAGVTWGNVQLLGVGC